MLLVSDYDGTYSNNDESIYLNNEAIEKFMKDGNTFVLSSGRSYTSLLKETIDYEIPYHYLGTNNGNCLFDSNGQLLYSSAIDRDILRSDAFNRMCDMSNRTRYYYEKVASDEYYPSRPINTVVFMINKRRITRKTVEALKELRNIAEDYEISDYPYQDVLCFFMKKKDVSKATGVEYLERNLQIPKKDIFTVGDAINDLEMIREYNGYQIGDRMSLSEVALDSYDTVHRLVKDIRSNKVKRRY